MRLFAPALVLLFALPPVAEADTPPVDPATVQAHELFDRAETDYALAHWQAALDGYSRAYEVKPLPAFLFNIGQCHRRMRHWEQAGYFYRTYLEREAQPKNRPLVESLIGEVDAAREAEEAASRALAAHRPVAKRWYFWTALGGAVLAGTAVTLGAVLGRQDIYQPGTLGPIDVR